MLSAASGLKYLVKNLTSKEKEHPVGMEGNSRVSGTAILPIRTDVSRNRMAVLQMFTTGVQYS